MKSFDVLFPELAAEECRMLRPIDNRDVPEGTFLFREFYCTEWGCDCRRVMLQVWWVEQRRVVATINYGFEPAAPPFEDEPRVFLDPLNPQSGHADGLFALFERMMAEDPAYHERLVRHYGTWKAVVDDPSHPDHPVVRDASHDDPDFEPAFPGRQEPARRPGAKIGRNDPCPCGSGRKYKRCCHAAGGPGLQVQSGE